MSHTRRVNVSKSPYHPRYVVWELTLRCDQLCTHCGSRAGDAREEELTTEEALDVVQQLADMGTKDVVLIGGEAYLHDGFLTIVRALCDVGIRPMMTTGGMGITPTLAADMKAAGLAQVSVSVDGLEICHDLVRGKKGSFRAAIRSLEVLREAGIPISANTNINRVNRGDVEGLYTFLVELGITSWQVQITVPLGRAADRPTMILQPYDLMTILPQLAAIKERAFDDGVLIMPGNNLGYFGPEEATMRSMAEHGKDHWASCMAGRFVMGIESDGAIKGCPSLQTASYVGGHVKEQSIDTIWNEAPELSFTRTRTVDDLWGFCKTCVFAEMCMAGCSFTSHALFGRPGNNPYCHYRARTLAKEGKRERLVPHTPAAGEPFDHGFFDILVEPLDAPEVWDSPSAPPVAAPAADASPEEKKKHLARLVKTFIYQKQRAS